MKKDFEREGEGGRGGKGRKEGELGKGERVEWVRSKGEYSKKLLSQPEIISRCKG